MKRHELAVSFEEKYYSMVRSVVDNYRHVNLIGHADGKGIFDSGILVVESDDKVEIWFKIRKGKLNYKLCMEAFHEMEQNGIVTINWKS